MHINKFKILLNEFLNETGMSKNLLAAKSGVPQSQVSDWSNGKGVRFTRNSKKVNLFPIKGQVLLKRRVFVYLYFLSANQ